MSGGGPDLGGGGGAGGTRTPCDQIRFDTTLASPDPAAIQSLSLNQVLMVRLEPQAGGATAIAAVTAAGVIVGAIVARVAELLPCLQRDFRYTATILSVAGGAVRVRIEPG